MADSNFTSTPGAVEETVPNSLYQKLFVSFIVLGSPAFLLNLFICGGILTTIKLSKNKSYLLLAGQTFVDAFCAGFAAAGIYRLYVSIVDPNGVRSPFSCFFKIPTMLITFFFPGQVVLMFIISIDRLIAVVWPFAYLKLTVKYAKNVLGTVLFFMVAQFILYAYTSYTSDQSIMAKAHCFWNSAFPDSILISVHYNGSAALAWVSIVLYLGIVIFYFLYTKKQLLGVSDKEKLRRLKKQQRLNTSLGLAALGTLMFYIIPNNGQALTTIFGIDGISKSTSTILAYSFGAAKNLNPICNFFIYMIRHKDIRVAVIKFVTCGKVVLHSNEMTTAGGATSMAVKSKMTSRRPENE